MLLVDNGKTQPAELYFLLNESMRTYDDLRLSVCDFPDRFLLRPGSQEHDPQTKVLNERTDIDKVLFRK